MPEKTPQGIASHGQTPKRSTRERTLARQRGGLSSPHGREKPQTSAHSYGTHRELQVMGRKRSDDLGEPRSLPVERSGVTRAENLILLACATVSREQLRRNSHAAAIGCDDGQVGIEEQFVRIGRVVVGQGDDREIGSPSALQ